MPTILSNPNNFPTYVIHAFLHDKTSPELIHTYKEGAAEQTIHEDFRNVDLTEHSNERRKKKDEKKTCWYPAYYASPTWSSSATSSNTGPYFQHRAAWGKVRMHTSMCVCATPTYTTFLLTWTPPLPPPIPFFQPPLALTHGC